MTQRTIIIGGGLAGLAAGVALADRGVSVTILESRPRLGGRASSFVDRETGEAIDNCQHVSLGCCTNFAHFCRVAGLAPSFRCDKTLYFVSPETANGVPKITPFAPSRLPAPMHIALAFQRLRYLSVPEKRKIARAMGALCQVRPEIADQQSFAHWLAEQGQSPAAIERFWNVVLVSALSETLDRISVGHARKVFVDAFLTNRRGGQVWIPTVPLDDLYGTQLTQWFTHRGVSIHLKAGVQRLIMDGDLIGRVELRDGRMLEADHFVLAVPYDRVLSLLPGELQNHRRLAGIAEMESAPIASVHLWFDRPITDLPHAVFVERTSQWMFNRTALQQGGARASKPSSYYYQVVISAARNLAGRTQESVIAEVVNELAEAWPETASARLVHGRLVTEHKAVLSVKPGIEKLRPGQQSPIANLQLAGDWTRTGWPSTMEGAVRSGYLAAENILGHMGCPTTIVQPDLPVARLSRLLLKL